MLDLPLLDLSLLLVLCLLFLNFVSIVLEVLLWDLVDVHVHLVDVVVMPLDVLWLALEDHAEVVVSLDLFAVATFSCLDHGDSSGDDGANID